VAWNKLCREKSKGGIGLRRMKHLNLVLRDKMDWQLPLKEDKDWIKICKSKYLNNHNQFLRIANPPYGSPFWNGIIKLKDWLGKNVKWEIGDGNNTFFWEDLWIRDTPLNSSKILRKGIP